MSASARSWPQVGRHALGEINQTLSLLCVDCAGLLAQHMPVAHRQPLPHSTPFDVHQDGSLSSQDAVSGIVPVFAVRRADVHSLDVLQSIKIK